jgi:hypothetical protein
MSKAPRHPEVRQENASTLESNNQILAATFDGAHALPLELAGHLVGLARRHQPRVVDLDALQLSTDESRLELHADRLDLGQLRHGRKGSRGLRARPW